MKSLIVFFLYFLAFQAIAQKYVDYSDFYGFNTKDNAIIYGLSKGNFLDGIIKNGKFVLQITLDQYKNEKCGYSKWAFWEKTRDLPEEEQAFLKSQEDDKKNTCLKNKFDDSFLNNLCLLLFNSQIRLILKLIL